MRNEYVLRVEEFKVEEHVPKLGRQAVEDTPNPALECEPGSSGSYTGSHVHGGSLERMWNEDRRIEKTKLVKSARLVEGRCKAVNSTTTDTRVPITCGPPRHAVKCKIVLIGRTNSLLAALITTKVFSFERSGHAADQLTLVEPLGCLLAITV